MEVVIKLEDWQVCELADILEALKSIGIDNPEVRQVRK